MKRVNQLLAFLLSAMLAVGSVQMPVIAGEAAGECVMAEAGADESADEVEEAEYDEESAQSMNGTADEEVDATETAEVVDTAVEEEGSFSEEVPVYINVTLDANGGYFVNEWDDVLGEYVEKTEILNKVILMGEVVSTYPVNEHEDQNNAATFLGWSLERDGKIVWQKSVSAELSQEEPVEQGQEEMAEQKGYIPVDNCVLYAVWNIEEAVANDENGESVEGDESAEERGNTSEAVSDPAEDEVSLEDGGQAENDDQLPGDETEVENTVGDSQESEVVEYTESGEDTEADAYDNIEDAQGNDSTGNSVEKTNPEPDAAEGSSQKDQNDDFPTLSYEGEQENESSDAMMSYEGDEMPEDAEYWAGHYYMAFDESLTPVEAAAKCESMGGYLATATTQAEYDLIWSLISAKSKGKPAYQLMGIQKRSDGWYWDDGEEFCFSTWAHFADTWGGDGWHTLGAGCLGWSDEEIKEAIPWGWSPIYESKWNGWCWELYLDEGTSASEHNIAICNGTLSFTRYANWGGRSSVSATGGMVEYNETNVATGYVCEWGDPVSLTAEHVFLNGQTKGKESPVRYTYSGTSCSPSSIKVFYDDVELSLNQDYTYEIKSRSQVGTARVNVTGINRYQDLAVKYYYVVPPKPDSVVLMQDVDHRSLNFSWDEVENAKGYLLQYSTDRDFQWNVTTVRPEEIDGCEYTTQPLQPETLYYFRVCASGDLNDDNCVSDWSSMLSTKTVSGLWLTIFSNRNEDVIDGGHAFLNIENLTDADVYIGNYKLSAGDNAYIAGRGFREGVETPVKQSLGGIHINYEGVQDYSELEDSGDNYYRNFAWFTVEIQSTDLKQLYSQMRLYGTYDFWSNNCTHFATRAWNSIVDESYKVPYTGVPGILKDFILETLKGNMATILKREEKGLYDILLMDSQGDLMPWTLDTGRYVSAVNSLKVKTKDDSSVTLIWDSPRFEIGTNQYNITEIRVQYSEKGKENYLEKVVPADCTEYKVAGLKPGTNYLFKIYGVSDHYLSGIGIVTGLKTHTVCEGTTDKASQSITAKSSASSIAVGKTATVSITGAKGKKSYKSSNTAIATVNASTGKVAAKKVGTVKITATSAATSNYKSASKTVTLKIVPAVTSKITAANLAKGIKVGWKKVTGANGYIIYRNNKKVKTITSGSTVTWTDTAANTNGAKYVYKVVAKASTGTSTLSKSLTTYRVAQPTVKTLKNSASKKMTATWGKNAKATGYQIQYSTSKTFASGNKTATVTKAGTVSKVIGSLTKGKTYYVRIRTYKTVGSTKFWSAWSAAKSVKISK